MKLKISFRDILLIALMSLVCFSSFSAVYSQTDLETKFYSYSQVLNNSLELDLKEINSFYIQDYQVDIKYKDDNIVLSVFSDYDYKSFTYLVDKINLSKSINEFNLSIKHNNVNIKLKNLNYFIEREKLDVLNNGLTGVFNSSSVTGILNSSSSTSNTNSSITPSTLSINSISSSTIGINSLNGIFSSEPKYNVIIKFNNYNYERLNIPKFKINSLGTLDYTFLNDSLGFDSDVLEENINFLIEDINKLSLLSASGFSTMSFADLIKEEFNLYGGVLSALTLKEISHLKGSSEYIEKIEFEKEYTILVEDAKDAINSSILETYLDSAGRFLTGDGVIVAVIDTGVDYTHLDFGSCSYSEYIDDSCERFVRGYDFSGMDTNPIDDQGHGSHVAGIIGSNGNIRGIAPNAKIMPIKVLNSAGSGTTADIIKGIEFAMDPNEDGDYSDAADIISMSLGGEGTPDDAISQISDLAVSRGIIVVVAAGNSGPYSSTVKSPGLARSVITVGASCMDSQVGVHSYCTTSKIATFSSRGPSFDPNSIKPEVVAPGVDICSTKASGTSGSTCKDSSHVAFSGTSMATPVVAGLIALLKQANPSITPVEMKSLLTNTASDLGDTIHAQGRGEVDAVAAYSSLEINQEILVDTSFIFFEDKNGIGFFEKNITIINKKNVSVSMDLIVSNFENHGINYSLGNISNSSLVLDPDVVNTVSFRINTSTIDGEYKGFISLVYSNSTIKIPIIITRYIIIDLTLSDGINGNKVAPESVYIFDGKVAKSMLQDSYNKYHIKAQVGNYTIFAIGEDSTGEYNYVLIKDVNVLTSVNYNVTLNTNESREYNVQGTGFKGGDLKTYEYTYGFNAYDDLSNISLSTVITNFDNLYGDQKFRISNNPSNVDNVDIVVKFEAIEMEE
jgi:subtilisin family serine protease